jgi:hypothetical protein
LAPAFRAPAQRPEPLARRAVWFSKTEAAFQQILKACKTHKVACAITANTPNDLVKRVKEGWNIIRSTVATVNAGRALLGEKPATSPSPPIPQ